MIKGLPHENEFTHTPLAVPDMLDPVIMPVQPLNTTAKTVAKFIILPVV